MMQPSKDMLFDRDTLKHLRLPFSFFLLPVYLFGISQTYSINFYNAFIIFITLHFFIYPASNIYNSYMDKDTGSIGGLKNPPPVTPKLFSASIIFDSIGLLLSLMINIRLMILMAIYIAISKAYSWNKIRLKRYAILSWIIVMIFQGAYTFLVVNMTSSDVFNISWFTNKNLHAMLLSSLLIAGSYPLTQIYQHVEDDKRGDKTISLLLGINGTFLLTAITFTIAGITAYFYFNNYYSAKQFFLFSSLLIPVILYFLYWANICRKNPTFADFNHTMRMIILSSSCMIICFLILCYQNH